MSSISVNRLTVICACALWFFILQSNTDPVTLSVAGENPASRDMTFPSLVKNVIFTFILILGIGENLSASGNMMSMERDWVVTAAAPDGYSRDITHLNSVMRRIDLVCKLIAPILISLIISATDVQIGVLVVAGMSAMSWSVEMLSARHVWNRNPALQELKVVPVHTLQSTDGMVPLRLNMLFGPVTRALEHYVQDFRNYFSTTIWIPSFSLSLLHLSALSYGATFITFLLSAGFSLDAITIARAIGSVVEISSTVVTPVGVHILGKASSHGKIGVLIDQRERAALSAPLIDARRSGDLSTEVVEERTVTGLERLGLWGLCWQLLNLVHFLTIPWIADCNKYI
jgi:iron-regulated transporter 1